MSERAAENAALRLAAIVASSDDAIVSKDLNGVVTSWNRAAEEMFGYTAAEAIGRHITFIIPKDRYSEEDEVVSRIRQGQSVEHFETIRQRKDGSLVPISLSVSPIRDPHGHVVGASKIARDISERVRVAGLLVEAEAAQADLQRRLLALVAGSGSLLGAAGLDSVLEGTMSLARELVPADAYAVWRLDPHTQEWRAAASVGLSAEFRALMLSALHADLSHVPFSEPIAVDDVESMTLLSRRTAAYAREGIKSLLIVPLPIRSQAAGTLVFYSRVRHIFTEVEIQTAKALGNLAAASMTTAELYDAQRRSREQSDFLVAAGSALAASRDYEAALAALARLAVPTIADWCVVDLLGKNGELRRVAVAHDDPEKLALAHLIQERYADPDSPYGVRAVLAIGKAVLVPHVSDAMLADLTRGDPERLQLVRTLGVTSYMCVPLMALQRAIGAITFVSAESKRHFTETDLAFAEQVASQAAFAVENARAYVDARDASRLKDEFLATLSHELRTPLNTLLGYARMLRSGIIVPDKQGRAVEIIERNATSLSQIVADVLDVSRIISGKLRLELQPVDPAIIIRDAIETVRPAADAKAVRIVTTIEPLDALPLADAARLQQVLWNLLSNAVKFTPSGGRIDARVLQGAKSADIEVSDTGIGIAADFLPFVFDRFRQADSRFSREHGGLGLGLAIARHIVEMHGGRLDAASAGRGQGATFRVSLPLAASGVEVASDRRVEPLLPPRLVGLHVLAVDDQEDTLTMLREALEAAGAQVTTALAGEEAIDIIEASPPDVLLADIGMGGMDGFELIRRVRGSRNLAAQRLPAAAITAYARPEDRVQALAHGFQLHVPKPVDPGEIVRIVGSLAGRD